MSKDMTTTSPRATSRRSFLKTGALAAAPLAAVVPAAALAADDGSKARLARLEDERAIADLHRGFLRAVSRGDAAARARLGKAVAALADDSAEEAAIRFSDDGLGATCRRACTASYRTEFTGHSTLEQMARLQGQGSHEHDEQRVLVTEYKKGKDGWAIASLHLA